MRCPHCKNRILQKAGSRTRLRIRGRIEVDDSGTCYALCHWCKGVIEIPFILQKGVKVPSEKFVISRG